MRLIILEGFYIWDNCAVLLNCRNGIAFKLGNIFVEQKKRGELMDNGVFFNVKRLLVGNKTAVLIVLLKMRIIKALL